MTIDEYYVDCLIADSIYVHENPVAKKILLHLRDRTKPNGHMIRRIFQCEDYDDLEEAISGLTHIDAISLNGGASLLTEYGRAVCRTVMQYDLETLEALE